MKKRKNKNCPDRTTPNEKKVCVIWTRVSTKEQADNNLSLDTQERACVDYAHRNGIEIYEKLGGTNESAKTEGKLFQEMITYVSVHRRVNMILVYSFDRFSRAGADAITTKAYLKSKGIDVVSVTQPIDSDNMAGEFMQNMIFLFNQFENNLRKEKCTAGMISCLEAGDWYSQPPIGYKIDRSSDKKHQLATTEDAKYIKMAFNWKAKEELQDTEIIKRLNNLGYKKLYKQRLTEVFHNPFYCGKIQHNLLGKDEEGNPRTVQGNHPAIVSEAIYNKVNGIETHIGYEHSVETVETPLKRHVICPVCGNYMTGYEVKAKGLFYYKCNTVGCKCNKSAKVLHSKYADLLDRYNVPEPIQDMVVETIKRVLEAKGIYVQDELKTLNARKTTLTKQKEDTMVKYGLGSIQEDVYTITRATLDRQLAEVEAELNKVTSNSSNLVNTVDDAVVTASKLSSYWKTGTFDNRQKIQNLVFPKGIYWDKEIDDYRTIEENDALSVMASISTSYKNGEIKKEGKTFVLSSVVAGAGLEPTTSGL